MTLNIYLLGPVQIKQNDDLIKMRGHKPPALLAYLLLTGQAHSRQQLVDLLFDRSDDPRASLRWTLSQLRRAIGADYIRADRQQVGFNFDSNYWLDVSEFEQGQIDLYRGDFLEGLHVRDAFGFEEWAFFERERLKKCYQTALVRQLEASEVEGDDQAVIEIAHRLLGLDDLREAWYRALMRAYARQGQREAALAQFELCRQVLQAELSVEPEIETADLATAIREGALRETELFRTPQASRPTVPLHNLPAQPTPFVGRETELADLDRLIRQEETRLVTIVGPGGVGKTRLAFAVAEYQLTDFGEVTPPATSRPGQPYPDGVFFVPLDFISSIDHIPLALAKALDFRLETSEAAGEQLLSPKKHVIRRQQERVAYPVLEPCVGGF